MSWLPGANQAKGLTAEFLKWPAPVTAFYLAGREAVKAFRATRLEADRLGGKVEQSLGRFKIASANKELQKLRREFKIPLGPVRLDADPKDFARIRKNFNSLENSAGRSLKEIRQTARSNMRLIRSTMGDQSEAGRKALATNFRLAHAAIRRSMRDGTTTTREGLAAIKSLMAEQLRQFGYTGRQAQLYLQGRNPVTGGPDEGGADIPRASGGYVGWPGERGRDKVRVVLGRGEAVLNRHQQVPVEAAMRTVWGIGLADLFRREQTPHHMAKGGFAGVDLRGADRDLAGYAKAAQRFGLVVSSGLRGGSITSSGNRSYHASGDALDLAGSGSAMLRFAKLAARRWGPRLEELIHTPLGFGIKNGKRVPPYAQADHYDHVHLADTDAAGAGGVFEFKPIGRVRVGGPGSPLKAIVQTGLDNARAAANARGKVIAGYARGGFVSTAYGPPWNAMNGTGVTATGRDLRPAKQAYGIAVDPRVIRLGSLVRAWPNPFGYRGLFRAFDTGGAIKGKRIDFYDWRGRRSQLGWGRRAVTLYDRDERVPGGGGSSGGARGRKKEVEPVPARVDPQLHSHIGSLTRRSESLGVRLEGIESGYALTERRHGRTEEDVATAGGYSQRGREISELIGIRRQQRSTLTARRRVVQVLVRDYSRAIRDLKRQFKRAPRGRRSAIKDRITEYQGRLAELRSEARTLGVSIDENLLDIRDLQDDLGELSAPMTLYGQQVEMIDAQERAGDISPATARMLREQAAQYALSGGWGSLSDRDRFQVKGDLTERTRESAEQGQNARLGQIGMRAALAALTPETADDEAAGKELVDYWTERLDQAKASGDVDAITEAATNLKSAQDALTSSTKDNTDAIKALTDEVAKLNSYRESVKTLTDAEVSRALADFIDGEIMGRRYSGRAMTAGHGSTWRA
ncbi:MAG: 3D domain-containing protein [Actinomycetota bacterium]|nr:3D domain-containing protein [Actinomycetota bacterium]